ncbi:hypothetical protein CPB86DRAFT_704632 [Serendipita vermifera]|nr:hypothetical protein CPB86DRAFT_704632 [Serendipita vermifera]
MLDKRQSFSFVWGFNDAALGSCRPASLFVQRDATDNAGAPAPAPPYTMIAYPESGIPTVDLLGSGDNLSWTPRFPAGTKVLLSLVDSNGNSGGVAQETDTIGSGTTTSCIPSTSTSSVRLSIEGPIGGTIQTCDTVPIHIEGGTKPYTVSIAVTNSGHTVNTTLTGDNDFFQWVARMGTGNSLIIAASDSTGQYATTTQFYSTGGSTDTGCNGKQDEQSVFSQNTSASSYTATGTTSRGTSTATSAPSNDQPKSGKSLTGPIIGTIIGILAIFGLIAFFFFKRRNQRHFNGDSSTVLSTMKDYKRGNNMAGNDSFVPLHDTESNTLRSPNMYRDQPSPHTANVPLGGTGPNRMSGLDYYSTPPSNYGGSMTSAGAAGVGAAHSHARSTQIMAANQQRGQQWGVSGAPPPGSAYAGSAYSADPFTDQAYPPSAGGNQASTFPPSTVDYAAYGHQSSRSGGGSLPYGQPPSQYNSQSTPPTSTATGTPRGGSQGSQDITNMTPAARAKAAEAAQERQTAYEDDEDPVPYLARNRMILGVTNPDRASVATSTMSDPYGGIAGGRASTISTNPQGQQQQHQVYQHEDGGAVIELPPAYREFSRTPAPPDAGRPPQ